MSDYRKNEFWLVCEDGCGGLKIASSKNDEDVLFSYYVSAFSSHQTSFLDTIKKRLSILWDVVILGKEYTFYEVLLYDNKVLEEFKNYVSSLEIKNDSE